MRRTQVAESAMPDGQETATPVARTTAFTSGEPAERVRSPPARQRQRRTGPRWPA
jgi:hypothetical protein